MKTEAEKKVGVLGLLTKYFTSLYFHKLCSLAFHLNRERWD